MKTINTTNPTTASAQTRALVPVVPAMPAVLGWAGLGMPLTHGVTVSSTGTNAVSRPKSVSNSISARPDAAGTDAVSTFAGYAAVPAAAGAVRGEQGRPPRGEPR